MNKLFSVLLFFSLYANANLADTTINSTANSTAVNVGDKVTYHVYGDPRVAKLSFYVNEVFKTRIGYEVRAQLTALSAMDTTVSQGWVKRMVLDDNHIYDYCRMGKITLRDGRVFTACQDPDQFDHLGNRFSNYRGKVALGVLRQIGGPVTIEFADYIPAATPTPTP